MKGNEHFIKLFIEGVLIYGGIFRPIIFLGRYIDRFAGSGVEFEKFWKT